MLQQIVDWSLYSLINLNAESKAVQSLNFFIYDSIKILLLLFFMILVVGYFRTYITPEKIKRLLSGKRQGASNFFASIFGAVTPFCSCSSIPLFLGFLEAGVPLGITFSFLITSPLVNEYLLVLMFGFFGWKITLAYAICGILIGTISGMILGKMGLEKHLVKDMKVKSTKEEIYNDYKERLRFGYDEAKSIVKKLWIWIIVGVGVGAIIHNYVPTETMQNIVSAGGIFAVPLAVILGVPLYGSCAAIVTIAIVLFQKGVPLGTALAFMMAISALSFPEAIMLRRAMKLKLILIFFGIVTLSIIIVGYLLNFFHSFLG